MTQHKKKVVGNSTPVNEERAYNPFWGEKYVI